MSARRWLPLIAACIGTFLLLTYATITTIAVPAIAVGLDGSTGAMSWVVDAYTLALAALLVGTGALGDAWGRKRLYVCGLVVFLVATALCAGAPDVTVLVAARGAEELPVRRCLRRSCLCSATRTQAVIVTSPLPRGALSLDWQPESETLQEGC